MAKPNEESPAHAPAPWFVRYDRDPEYASTARIVDEAELLIATVHHQHLDPHEMLDAKARLIAAAPDLLAACERMCGMIYRDKNDERIDFDVYEEAELACRRAIAMANGNSSFPK